MRNIFETTEELHLVPTEVPLKSITLFGTITADSVIHIHIFQIQSILHSATK